MIRRLRSTAYAFLLRYGGLIAKSDFLIVYVLFDGLRVPVAHIAFAVVLSPQRRVAITDVASSSAQCL